MGSGKIKTDVGGRIYRLQERPQSEDKRGIRHKKQLRKIKQKTGFHCILSAYS